MDWSNMIDERDADGTLTPLALALDAIEDAGCDCGTDEPCTCLVCLCEAALRAERAEVERLRGMLGLVDSVDECGVMRPPHVVIDMIRAALAEAGMDRGTQGGVKPMSADAHRIRLVYVAGPYRAATCWEEEQNMRRAELAGFRIARLGAMPVIPHANTRPYFGDAQGQEFWLAGTKELMRRCDAVFLLPGWDRSDGATKERADAYARGMPVFTAADQVARWLAEDVA